MQEYHYDIHIPHFNSCARDGRNTLDEDIIIKIKISIHAPAMGATAITISRGVSIVFQFMRPRWAQLQDLDTILLSILHSVYKRHFPI